MTSGSATTSRNTGECPQPAPGLVPDPSRVQGQASANGSGLAWACAADTTSRNDFLGNRLREGQICPSVFSNPEKPRHNSSISRGRKLPWSNRRISLLSPPLVECGNLGSWRASLQATAPHAHSLQAWWATRITVFAVTFLLVFRRINPDSGAGWPSQPHLKRPGKQWRLQPPLAVTAARVSKEWAAGPAGPSKSVDAGRLQK
jgi:hypothetical protein